ncbi:hypothetical protein BaRGS_00037519 [Batillaria attramentaria]|uniref:Uncharacterized protein n=1 Tax=Batillaria attramentaria TaxID=370345 RepID=A0ABD0J8C3_9CAEN
MAEIVMMTLHVSSLFFHQFSLSAKETHNTVSNTNYKGFRVSFDEIMHSGPVCSGAAAALRQIRCAVHSASRRKDIQGLVHSISAPPPPCVMGWIGFSGIYGIS